MKAYSTIIGRQLQRTDDRCENTVMATNTQSATSGQQIPPPTFVAG
ncbi:MAG: hypothetical protein PHI11_09360 [Gallionella sp.]|nr:hypothetical protein [Gallionella sp.]